MGHRAAAKHLATPHAVLQKLSIIIQRQREGEKEREGGREDRHGDSGRMRQEGRMDKIAVFIKSTANWCPCVHSNAGVSIAVVHHRKIYTLKVQWL